MLEDINFELTLIRHAQSEINAQPDLMGQLHDTPLSDLGHIQSLSLKNRFQKEKTNFDIVFCSPYVRALNTAKIALGDDIPLLIHDSLREYHAGDWCGGSRSKLLTSEIRNKMNYLNHCFSPPNGESLSRVERRVSEFVDDYLYDPDMNGKHIGIFTHGQVIKCLLHHIMGFDKSFTWKLSIDNTSLTKLSFSEIGWKVLYINDYSHLRI